MSTEIHTESSYISSMVTRLYLSIDSTVYGVALLNLRVDVSFYLLLFVYAKMHLNLKHVFLLHFTTIAMPCTQERERTHSELLAIKKLVELKLGGEYFGLQLDVQITDAWS